MTIETVGIEEIDEEKYHIGTPVEHLTIKEAKAWIKEIVSDCDYWDYKAERKGFFREVKFIHILKDGEIHTEYLTNFA
jgi:hypothetical protein